ncbi:protein of unknown function [Tenacibaculum aestuariivivum]
MELLRPENIEIRKQVDIWCFYEGKIVILYEIRSDSNNEKRSSFLISHKSKKTKLYNLVFFIYVIIRVLF